MNKTRVINYNKLFSKDGTVYKQGIHITAEEYDILFDMLQAEKYNPTSSDYYFQLYIKQPMERYKNVFTTNNTQRDYIAKKLHLDKLKRYHDENTYFIID